MTHTCTYDHMTHTCTYDHTRDLHMYLKSLIKI